MVFLCFLGLSLWFLASGIICLSEFFFLNIGKRFKQNMPRFHRKHSNTLDSLPKCIVVILRFLTRTQVKIAALRLEFPQRQAE